METKLPSLLTVLSIAITAVVAVYLFTGAGYAIELAVVSLTALAAWLRWSFRELPSQRQLVGPYILVIVTALAMNTGRTGRITRPSLLTTGRHSSRLVSG
jgi:hypothetical protein